MTKGLSEFRCERIGGATLYLGDCLEIMPLLGEFDAVVTDPPYGVKYEGSKTKHGHNGYSYGSFDDTPEYISKICVPAVRMAVAKSKAAIVTPGIKNAFKYDVPKSFSSIFYPSGANCGPWGFVCAQPLFYYGNCPYLAKGMGSRPDGFSSTEASNRSINHPCPKPIKQTEWKVNRVSLKADAVLDPFMGSGTTGVACAKMGRKFTGIELDSDYFEIACERIRKAYEQPDFFVATPENPPKPVQESML